MNSFLILFLFFLCCYYFVKKYNFDQFFSFEEFFSYLIRWYALSSYKRKKKINKSIPLNDSFLDVVSPRNNSLYHIYFSDLSTEAILSDRHFSLISSFPLSKLVGFTK